jgi:hypothetical protein
LNSIAVGEVVRHARRGADGRLTPGSGYRLAFESGRVS